MHGYTTSGECGRLPSLWITSFAETRNTSRVKSLVSLSNIRGSELKQKDEGYPKTGIITDLVNMAAMMLTQ
jgi:hypothetical protein